MTSRYVNVQTYKTSIGHRCMRCTESATVRAWRKKHGTKLPVHYCAEHAVELGVLDG